MAKHYDIYTQIPGIKPCPQKWVVENDTPADSLVNFNSGLMRVTNIVGTTAKKLSDTKALICRQEYFICCVQSWYGGEHHE